MGQRGRGGWPWRRKAKTKVLRHKSKCTVELWIVLSHPFFLQILDFKTQEMNCWLIFMNVILPTLFNSAKTFFPLKMKSQMPADRIYPKIIDNFPTWRCGRVSKLLKQSSNVFQCSTFQIMSKRVGYLWQAKG